MKKKPFFSKFLENQIKHADQVKGGHHKDGHAGGPCDNPGFNPNCLPDYVTLKYPCDQADSGLPC